MNNTRSKIFEYISENGKITVGQLFDSFPIGRQMIHRHLSVLVKEGKLKKEGTPPRVFYSINDNSIQKNLIYNIKNYKIEPQVVKIIDNNFTLLEPNGTEIEGFNGFAKWCNDRNFNVENRAIEYANLIKEYDVFKKEDFIEATQKVISTFNSGERFLDELYYMYPYSFPIFGKTKMGQWLFHAKQTQDKELIKRVLGIVIPQINKFIEVKKIKAIAFVPPTVPRGIQFMTELKKSLKSILPIIKIEKIKTKILIQQKTLKEIRDRVKNAQETMVVGIENTNYDNLLLLDDFTGSGSTLNILSQKIKKQNIAQKVIGLTITGSIKGFEVIREV